MLRLICYLALTILNHLGGAIDQGEVSGWRNNEQVTALKTKTSHADLKENSEINPECKSYDIY